MDNGVHLRIYLHLDVRTEVTSVSEFTEYRPLSFKKQKYTKTVKSTEEIISQESEEEGKLVIGQSDP
jgi:hypothetical protein